MKIVSTHALCQTASPHRLPMVVADSHAPRSYKGVMVSSTFTDLEEHRAELIKIIERRGLKAIPMEYDAALPATDVIDSSLGKVRDGSAYVGIIAKRYGQVPPCAKRNPRKLSITELEFDEAVKLNRPILLFLMGDDHLVRECQIETKAANKKKLRVFRERAKEMGPDTKVHRVYATFGSLEQFKEIAAQSVDALCRHLDDFERTASEPENRPRKDDAAENSAADLIPPPPAFYAEPAYLGSHDFVGRRDQLETLNEWALPADSHPMLLFEAIGGTGKSMLTWEWVRNHTPHVRKDWAGRFWYSFYERGAIMADFCQRALAYMTGQPLEELRKKKTTELAPQLLHQLQARPWLLILDGLERVLVAYHRIDAAQLPDEEAGKTDEIAQRDVCAAIRPEDDELLRALAAAAPSKLLLTSRLIPRVLLNKASQPIPGVQRVLLAGLRPADAEALFRTCGVTGDSSAIQAYLKTHCDCHPLTIGVLAGLVKDYLPDRGNFDRWAADPEGGGRLNLADLDLVQKRNHILLAAIAALSAKSRQLLSMIALLSEAVDYETLQTLNPNLPAEIEEVPMPEKPEDGWYWEDMSVEEKEEVKKRSAAALRRRAEYKEAVQARLRTPEFLGARRLLGITIKDLERRGLLQYDAQAKHYNLHPVVRGVAAGGLPQTERETYGQRVVDYFSSRPHKAYEHAETLEDVRDDLQVVRTLIQMGRFQQACDTYRGGLARALLFNLEANAEIVALLRPFFPTGWGDLPQNMGENDASYLANDAAIALGRLGQQAAELLGYESAISAVLQRKDWPTVCVYLRNVAITFFEKGKPAKADSYLRLALDVAGLVNNDGELFMTRLLQLQQLSYRGQWAEAEEIWECLDRMGRDWGHTSYRHGYAEFHYACSRFEQGNLLEEHLSNAEKLAVEGRTRQIIRWLRRLRGEWQIEKREWGLAAKSLRDSVRMAREVGQTDPVAETLLALAKFHLGEVADSRHEAEQLASAPWLFRLGLAELWLAIGDREQAKKYALAAYQRAWADGEPFVWRYGLNKSRALLEQLGTEIPNLPPYDPTKDEKLPWEDTVVAAIEELRAENAAKSSAKEIEGELGGPTKNQGGDSERS